MPEHTRLMWGVYVCARVCWLELLYVNLFTPTLLIYTVPRIFIPFVIKVGVCIYIIGCLRHMCLLISQPEYNLFPTEFLVTSWFVDSSIQGSWQPARYFDTLLPSCGSLWSLLLFISILSFPFTSWLLFQYSFIDAPSFSYSFSPLHLLHFLCPQLFRTISVRVVGVRSST